MNFFSKIADIRANYKDFYRYAAYKEDDDQRGPKTHLKALFTGTSEGEKGRVMKAFRPSKYGLGEDEPQEHRPDEHAEARQANVKIYAQRAKAKLPLFDDTKPLRAAG